MLTIGAACTLAIAACGSATKPIRTGASSGAANQLRFAACMRSHGVPSFPDPSPPGASLTGNTFGGFAIPAGLDVQSPAFQSAHNACRVDLGGGTPHRGVSANDRRSMLRHAQCMRTHGVPGYPDPVIPSHGPIISRAPTGPGVNPDSPAFERAAADCGGA